MFMLLCCYCAVPENIHTPTTEGIGISWGMGGSVRPKNLKKCMEFNWNFQRGGWERGGGGCLTIPSVREVWIFSGITHYDITVYVRMFTQQNKTSLCSYLVMLMSPGQVKN